MADIEPAHSLMLNGYSKRIQDLIQSTKNKISQYGSHNEKINEAIKKITEISHPYVEKYGQYFNGKLEIAKNLVPNKLDLHALEKFQATREKVLVLSDKFLTSAEEQINGLYNSLALPEEKSVAVPEQKAIKPRVQALLRKTNVLLFTLLNKVYEEIRTKNLNKESVMKVWAQVQEKLEKYEIYEDVKIVTAIFYEHLRAQLLLPSLEMIYRGKDVLVKIPTQLKTVDLMALVEKYRAKYATLRDATFVFYKDHVVVLMNKNELKKESLLALEFLKKKTEWVMDTDFKERGLDLLDDGKTKSIELYNEAKKRMIEEREMMRKEYRERKLAKKLKEKAIEMEEHHEEQKAKELQGIVEVQEKEVEKKEEEIPVSHENH